MPHNHFYIQYHANFYHIQTWIPISMFSYVIYCRMWMLYNLVNKLYTMATLWCFSMVMCNIILYNNHIMMPMIYGHV